MEHGSRVAARIALAVFISTAAAILLTAVGCATIRLGEDYTPRLSSRTMHAEDEIKSVDTGSAILVLDYLDSRAERARIDAKPEDTFLLQEARHYGNPHFVWSQRFFTYSLSNKTLGQYLADSLVFELKRMKIPVSLPTAERSIFSGSFEGHSYNQRFVIGIELLRFRPDYKPGFSTVTPYYIYTTRLKLWDAEYARLILDETIDKVIEDTPANITFHYMIYMQMNDHLCEYNLELIRVISAALSAH